MTPNLSLAQLTSELRGKYRQEIRAVIMSLEHGLSVEEATDRILDLLTAQFFDGYAYGVLTEGDADSAFIPTSYKNGIQEQKKV